MRKIFYAAFLIAILSQTMVAGRYYDARTGRFLQVDPQTHLTPEFSPYAYCTDNPIKNIDPDGNFSLPANSIKSPSQRVDEITNSVHSALTALKNGQIVDGVGGLLSAGAQAVGLVTNPTGTESLLPDASIISASGEKAAAEVVSKEATNLSPSQAKNLSRFEKNLPIASGKTVVKELPNGGKAFQADVPAKNIPGSKATYEKQVDNTGKTREFTKTTYDKNGNIVHVKDKIRGVTLTPEEK
jgi:hypothetical protein